MELLFLFILPLVAVVIGYFIGRALHGLPDEELLQRQAEIAFEQGARAAYREMERQKKTQKKQKQ